MPYGTLSISDLLANQNTIAKIGEDNAFQAIDAARNAHNAIVAEMLAPLVDTTTDLQRRYGGVDQFTMDEIDEYGTPDVQKIAAGSIVGFPMRLYGGALQWTRKYFQTATGKELAEQYIGMEDADLRNTIRLVKKTIFTPTNYTFIDRLTNNAINLFVKALANADGAPIPAGPNGEIFDGTTHNHYLGTASFVASDLTALTETVIEHWNEGQCLVYINRAQEAAIRAFTGFSPYLDARLIPQTTVTIGAEPLNQRNLYNRAIGVFGAAEVWVKPWMPSGYAFAFMSGAPKPVVMRERNPGSGTLQLVGDYDEHPLRSRTYERECGFGVWTRTNGAVLDTAHATYNTPVITL